MAFQFQIPSNFSGPLTVSYNDWLKQQLAQYASSQANIPSNEVSNGSPSWLKTLYPEASSDVYSPQASGYSDIASRLAAAGMTPQDIGFDPAAQLKFLQSNTRPQLFGGGPSKYGSAAGYYTPDASGNMVIPTFNNHESDWGQGIFGLSLMAGPILGGISGMAAAGEGAVAGDAALAGGGEVGSGYAASAPAASGAAGGTAAGDATLAGGGEVGSGYAASAPASSGGGEIAGATGSGSALGGNGANSGAGTDFGMTGNEGAAATNTGTSSGATMGDTGAGFDFGLTGNEGAGSGFGFNDIWNFVKANPSLIGSLGGALLGGAKGGAQPAGTVTTTQDLAPWLQPYAAANVAQGAQTLAGINPNNPLLPASQNEAMKTIRGDYLNPNSNPYLAQSVNDSLGLARAQLNSQFTGAFGDPNNTGTNEAIARGLGATATNAYMNNFQNERARQATAAFGAPQLVSQGNAALFSPNQAFSGLFPNVTSTQTPYFTNNLGSIFGGALAGGALGKAFGG